MVDEQLLSLICCPETQQDLCLLEKSTVQKLNELQGSGQLAFRNGRSVGYRLSDALIRKDQKVIYPVREDIPVLLIEEGILTEGLVYHDLF